jgi:hypothetical protein
MTETASTRDLMMLAISDVEGESAMKRNRHSGVQTGFAQRQAGAEVR